MDKINALAKKYNLKVVADACEAHFAEWKGKKVGTLGDLGCFSFQNGKSLTCGEGGAILGSDEKLMDLCYSFHNFGRPKGRFMSRDKGGHPILGTKCRMAEYQASMLLTQMERAEEQTRKRCQNADYLTSRIEQIPGILPRKDYEKTNVTSYYYYAFRYKQEQFKGLSRNKFIPALNAELNLEGHSANAGLGVIEGKPQNKEGLIEDALHSKSFQKLYSKERLNKYRGNNDCPKCEQLCKETVGFHQPILLGTRKDMDSIADAIEKIYENRDQLA